MHINKERLIKTFLELVQIDSPSGFEQEIVKFICDWLETRDIKYTADKFGNIIATLASNTDNEYVLLTVHLDTVEPGRGIKPIIEQNIIKSSGNTILGADNKVGVAVILETIETILESNIFTKNIEVVFTLSEEIGNFGAVNLNYPLLHSKHGYSFDGSGPVGSIVTASPFYNRIDLQILGKASHAAHPEDSVNALTIAANAISRLKFGRVDESTYANIGVISGGSVRNTIPGEINLKGEVRSYKEELLEKELQTIISEFEKTANDYGGKVKYESVRENPGFEFDKNSDLVQKGIKALETLNIKPNLQRSTGCYDANVFFANSIEVLNFTNGSMHSHTVEEMIAVEELVKTAELCLELVKK